MQWLNEPGEWSENGSTITVRSDPESDFWRITNGGAVRDNGHFYFTNVWGDFNAQVRIQGDLNSRYDQMGLMLRFSDTLWMKCGVEYVEGTRYASVVVTREQSDWSVTDVTSGPNVLWFRVTTEGGTVLVAYSEDGSQFHLLREAYLKTGGSIDVRGDVRVTGRGRIHRNVRGLRRDPKPGRRRSRRGPRAMLPPSLEPRHGGRAPCTSALSGHEIDRLREDRTGDCPR